MFIKTEKEIMKNWNRDISIPLVSVVCIVYNHEKFLSQAIESFLIQETNFPFEIVVGEDKSTDNSLKVIQFYIRKYPNIIRVITSENNVGMQKNFLRTMDASQGKYIALCEGDDYWCDKDKLQKQFDYLESDEECVLVHHDSVIVDFNDNLISESKNPNNRDFTSEEMLCGETFILTNTVMMRNIKFNDIPDDLKNAYNFDIVLWHMLSQYGHAKYQPRINAAYRIHPGGVWSSLSIVNKLQKTIDTRSKMLANNINDDTHRKRIKKSMNIAALEGMQNTFAKFYFSALYDIQTMILKNKNIDNSIIVKFYFKVLPLMIMKKINKIWK